MLGPTAKVLDGGEVVNPGLVGIGEMNHRHQMRQPRGPQRAWRTVGELRRQRPDDLDVIGGFESIRGDQRTTFDLVQRVFQFRRAIPGVDVDQDQSRLGGGILRQNPFDPVGRPQADPISRRQSQGDQPSRKTVNLPAQSREAEAHVLVADHNGFAVWPAFGSLIQRPAERVVEQLHRRCAMEVAAGRIGHVAPAVSAEFSCTVYWPPKLAMIGDCLKLIHCT